jgi:hypothetical protein
MTLVINPKRVKLQVLRPHSIEPLTSDDAEFENWGRFFIFKNNEAAAYYAVASYRSVLAEYSTPLNNREAGARNMT